MVQETRPGPAELSPDEIRRYSRHLLLPEVGLEGQQAIKAAKVLCVGAGGLGSPVAMYLAAAGVGTLGIVDFDVVDFSNLQRQILHMTRDVGRPKVESARERLKAINPEVRVETHEVALSSANALDLVARYDVIVDGTDNFPTRYLVNDACVLTRQAVRLRQRLPLRRAGLGLRDRGRPLLPLPLPGAAAARPRPELRRRRRARRAARHHRDHPGDRGAQADPEGGRAAGRPAAASSTRSR